MSASPKELHESQIAPDVKVRDLLPEIFTTKRLWDILASQYFGPVIDDLVVEYIRRLEQLRWLSYHDKDLGKRVATNDEGLLANSASLLGFNMSFDVYDNVKEKLLSHITQLALYYLTNGPGIQSTYTDSNNVPASSSFTNFIAYILGTTVSYRELYSNSTDLITYRDMEIAIPSSGIERTNSSIPISSNTWFKTTHIRLSIDITDLQVNLANRDRDGRNFEDRVKELFYAYSPINLVVDSTDFVYKMAGDFSFVGTLLPIDTLYYKIGYEARTISTIEVSGPSQIISLATASYYLTVTYNNGDVDYKNATKWKSGEVSKLSISSLGLGTAGLVSATTPVRITATYGSKTAYKDVDIIPPPSDPVVSIEIVGDDIIYEDNTSTPEYHLYTLKVTTQSGNVYYASSNMDWNVVGYASSMGDKRVTSTQNLELAITNI